jgi:hypothetical protein
VSGAIDNDMFEPEGERLVAVKSLDIYSYKLLDEEATNAVVAGFQTQ